MTASCFCVQNQSNFHMVEALLSVEVEMSILVQKDVFTESHEGRGPQRGTVTACAVTSSYWAALESSRELKRKKKKRIKRKIFLKCLLFTKLVRILCMLYVVKCLVFCKDLYADLEHCFSTNIALADGISTFATNPHTWLLASIYLWNILAFYPEYLHQPCSNKEVKTEDRRIATKYISGCLLNSHGAVVSHACICTRARTCS